MSGPNGINPNALRGAQLLGQAVVRIELAAGITIELSEPDPNKIDPRQVAPLQALVMLAHAIASNYRQQTSHDNALQSMIHAVAWLMRRVELLEQRQLLMMPADELEPFVAIARQNIASASEQLHAAWQQQQQPQPEQEGEPS